MLALWCSILDLWSSSLPSSKSPISSDERLLHVRDKDHCIDRFAVILRVQHGIAVEVGLEHGRTRERLDCRRSCDELLIQVVKDRADSVNNQCPLGHLDQVIVGVGHTAVIAKRV